MPMTHSGESRETVSVSSPSFTLTSWPFAVPKIRPDDGRQRVVAGERMFDRATGVLRYGAADLVPVDEWSSLIGEAEYAPFLRGQISELPPAREHGEVVHQSAPTPARVRNRTRGGSR